VLIDDALAGNDPATGVKLYTAPADLYPFAEATTPLAHPALGTFLHTQEVLSLARNAKRMPAREGEYRNLLLNQPLHTTNMFVSPAVWKACSTPVGSLSGLTVYGGLDLSEVADLTALVLIGSRDGRWHVEPTFWLPSEGLSEKATVDRLPYDLWRAQGFLQ